MALLNFEKVSFDEIRTPVLLNTGCIVISTEEHILSCALSRQGS